MATFAIGSDLSGEYHHYSFKYPKPKELVKYLIRISGVFDGYVMDSFAGSGTTGQAVLELNQEDGGNRRFVLLELEEEIASKIAAERLKKVVEGYVDRRGKRVDGVGGSGFQYCQLSQRPLFQADGSIRPDVKFKDLAEFVWFKETGTGFGSKAKSPLIGVHEGRAVYLLYNGVLGDKSSAGGNVLTGKILGVLPKHDGPKVIYAAACRLSSARLQRENIIFKQTPYALEV